uniref:Uncharacterized protein n=1 Tax=Kalanchoe fedtschenkoi TaxID=63787 RepID=A0A7N0UF87_KALFE
MTNPLLHRNTLLSAILLLSATATASASASDQSNATVYDMLPKFGLPSGLLPSSVTSYSYSPSDGRFEVHLDRPCYIQFDYLVYYDRRITGKLKYGSITDLNGIQVQKFFLWLSVDEIRVDLPPSDYIYFQVGVINKKLDVSQFQTVHACRNKALVPCDGSWKSLIQPVTVSKDVEMLLTE